MREQIKKGIKIKGAEFYFNGVSQAALDLKRAGYIKTEIAETLKEFYFGIDGKLDIHVNRVIENIK